MLSMKLDLFSVTWGDAGVELQAGEPGAHQPHDNEEHA